MHVCALRVGREKGGGGTTDSEQIGSVCLSQEKLNGGR